jgi:hypothetical protein
MAFTGNKLLNNFTVLIHNVRPPCTSYYMVRGLILESLFFVLGPLPLFEVN